MNVSHLTIMQTHPVNTDKTVSHHQRAGISHIVKLITLVFLLCIIGQITHNCSFHVFRLMYSCDESVYLFTNTNFKMLQTVKKKKKRM